MRIVAGEYGGRVLVAPKTTATRPMMDKVRAAVFNRLGSDRFSGAAVLDVYAGSGALAFEALSRGASMASVIEPAKAALAAIEQNRKTLGVGWGLSVFPVTVESWLAKYPETQSYDVVFADPPYAELQVDVIERLAGLLKPDGVLVLSHSSKVPAPNLPSVGAAQTKEYGDTAISLYYALD